MGEGDVLGVKGSLLRRDLLPRLASLLGVGVSLEDCVVVLVSAETWELRQSEFEDVDAEHELILSLLVVSWPLCNGVCDVSGGRLGPCILA